MRLAGIAMIMGLALAACAPQTSAPGEDLSAVQPCADVAPSDALTASECAMQAQGQTLLVKFAPLAAGASFGMVTIDVLNERGDVVQSMSEPDVSQYIPPTIEDVDGDGRADLLVTRETFNANATSGVWIYNGERGVYERAGQINGVGFERTEDGLIAVPARSSATEWDVTYYKLDEGGLHELLTVEVTAPSGRSTEPSCGLATTPGLRELGLSEVQARTRFCAEHAAQVFAP